MTGDAALLADIHRSSFAMSRPWSEDEISGLLRAPGSVLRSTSDGFALGRVIADEGEILTIAVLPAKRRQGIARQLLHDLEMAFIAKGAQKAFLEVASRNEAARALYEVSGYNAAGHRRGYYRFRDGAADDALILSKVLA